MAKSRRRLTFSPPVEEQESKQGNICTLCLTPHTQLSAPASWKNLYAQQVACAQLRLPQQSLVCRLCRDDIGKLIKNPERTPRWVKGGRKTNCCIPSCSNTAFVKSKIATNQQTAHILKLETEEDIPYPTPLCKQHYHAIYDALQNKQTHCCTCRSSLRTVPARVCPNANHIQQYLAEKTGFEGDIPEGAQVCMTCYRSHLQILKEAPVSTDSDLLALIDTLKGCVPAIEHVKNIDDIINKAMYTTAIHVGERLLQQESLLLPSVHETFCVHVSDISQLT